jgi:hypothetical protein
VRRSQVEALLDEAPPALERRLLETTLRAAADDQWQTWPAAASETACRAALIRGLYTLNTDEPIAALLTAAQEACAAGEAP